MAETSLNVTDKLNLLWFNIILIFFCSHQNMYNWHIERRTHILEKNLTHIFKYTIHVSIPSWPFYSINVNDCPILIRSCMWTFCTLTGASSQNSIASGIYFKRSITLETQLYKLPLFRQWSFRFWFQWFI